MEKDIFVEIMELIENKGGIPLLAHNLDEWISKDPKKNMCLYNIYCLACNGRRLT